VDSIANIGVKKIILFVQVLHWITLVKLDLNCEGKLLDETRENYTWLQVVMVKLIVMVKMEKEREHC